MHIHFGNLVVWWFFLLWVYIADYQIPIAFDTHPWYKNSRVSRQLVCRMIVVCISLPGPQAQQKWAPVSIVIGISKQFECEVKINLKDSIRTSGLAWLMSSDIIIEIAFTLKSAFKPTFETTASKSASTHPNLSCMYCRSKAYGWVGGLMALTTA